MTEHPPDAQRVRTDSFDGADLDAFIVERDALLALLAEARPLVHWFMTPPKERPASLSAKNDLLARVDAALSGRP